MKSTNLMKMACDYLSKAVASAAVIGMLAASGCASTQIKTGESINPFSNIIYVSETDRGDKTFFGDFSHYSTLLADVTRKVSTEDLRDTLEEFADDIEEQKPEYLKLMMAKNLDMNYAILGDYGNYHFLLGFNNQGKVTHLEMFTWKGKQYFDVYRDHPTTPASPLDLPDIYVTYSSSLKGGWDDFVPRNLDAILQPVETALRTDLQKMDLANRRSPLTLHAAKNNPTQLEKEEEPHKVDYNAEPGTKAVQAADKELRLAGLINQVVEKTGVDRKDVVCLSGARGALYDQTLFRAIDRHLGIDRRRLPDNVRKINYESVHGVSENRFAQVIAVNREFTDGRVERRVFDFGESRFYNKYGNYNLECGVTKFDVVKEVKDYVR